MISRKIPKFLKISHHKFTSRKLFSHIFPKNPKTGNQVFPNIPRFSHFGKYIPFCVGIPILGKVGKPAKTKLVRAAPKLHTMENNGENLGIFGKFFPNFPKREIFFPKKLLFLTVYAMLYAIYDYSFDDHSCMFILSCLSIYVYSSMYKMDLGIGLRHSRRM